MQMLNIVTKKQEKKGDFDKTHGKQETFSWSAEICIFQTKSSGFFIFSKILKWCSYVRAKYL